MSFIKKYKDEDLKKVINLGEFDDDVRKKISKQSNNIKKNVKKIKIFKYKIDDKFNNKDYIKIEFNKFRKSIVNGSIYIKYPLHSFVFLVSQFNPRNVIYK